jgi:phosphoenolpyruvate carboxykinase (GTP)
MGRKIVDSVRKLLQERLDSDNFNKLTALNNPKMHAFVAEAIGLTEPESVFVCTDADEDLAYIRALAIEAGEERPLAN